MISLTFMVLSKLQGLCPKKASSISGVHVIAAHICELRLQGPRQPASISQDSLQTTVASPA